MQIVTLRILAPDDMINSVADPVGVQWVPWRPSFEVYQTVATLFPGPDNWIINKWWIRWMVEDGQMNGGAIMN